MKTNRLPSPAIAGPAKFALRIVLLPAAVFLSPLPFFFFLLHPFARPILKFSLTVARNNVIFLENAPSRVRRLYLETFQINQRDIWPMLNYFLVKKRKINFRGTITLFITMKIYTRLLTRAINPPKVHLIEKHVKTKL